MNKFTARHRRRFRIVARSQIRGRRVRLSAACVVVFVLGVVAVVTVRKSALEFHAPAFAGRVDAVATVVGPEPLRSLAQATVDSISGTAGDKASALKAKYPALADVRVSCDWTQKTATLTLVVRRAVAVATRRGKPAGLLGDDGTVFEAPAGAAIMTGPTVEVAGASAGELFVLAHEWPVLSAAGAFPAVLKAISYGSRENGWEASLADGAIVRWGRLEWTREKLSRLSEAVADARLKEPGVFSADLRWFEDGKVLLKPALEQAANSR